MLEFCNTMEIMVHLAYPLLNYSSQRLDLEIIQEREKRMMHCLEYCCEDRD